MANPTSTDQFTLASNTALTAKVQVLGAEQARTIIQESRSNPTGALVTGVAFSDAVGIAERFLGDLGRWAGLMAIAMIYDGAFTTLWTNNSGAYPSLTVSPDVWDAAINTVLPYVFADFVNVV